MKIEGLYDYFKLNYKKKIKSKIIQYMYTIIKLHNLLDYLRLKVNTLF